MKTVLQLYTVRKLTKKQLRPVLEQIRHAGYDGIEAARIPFDENTAGILKEAGQNLGLEVVSSQIKLFHLRDEFKQMCHWLHTVECSNAVVSVLPKEVFGKGEDAFKRFCTQLNLLGKQYSREGIQLAFHHHNFEFLKYGDKRGITLLLENLNPEYVKIICDTFWIQKGGYTPEHFLKQLGDFSLGVHLRDYDVKGKIPLIYATDAPIGEGLLNMEAIIRQCYDNNMEYMAVEQNSKDPLNDMKRSMDAIQKILGMVQRKK